MLFEEVIEMSHFRKAQGIGNVGYPPGTAFEERFRLLQNAVGDELRGCSLSRFLDRPV